MTAKILNPDSTVLQQVDGQWMKLATLILWKTAGRGKVTITAADMQAMSDAFAPGIPTLMTHGHVDSFDFQIIDAEAAERLAAHDATQRGTS